MALITWNQGPFGTGNIFNELERLRNQMSGFLGDYYGQREGFTPATAGVFPLLNMSEDEDSLYVTAELAGVPTGDIELSVENNTLTIRGERRIAEVDPKISYHRREREAGIFRRVLSLPYPVDVNQVTAVSKNGVLTIKLPKAPEAKPRQIPITVS